MFAVAATLVAPLIAIQISKWLSDRKEQKQRKFEVFKTLMSWRALGWAEPNVQALNLIDVLFHDVKSVRNAWQELYAAYCDQGLSTPEGGRLRIDKRNKLLMLIADHLGYANEFSHADFERVYIPEALDKFYANHLLQTQLAYQQNQAQMLQSPTIPPGATPPSNGNS